MAEKKYDELITNHYREVANKDGLESTSTMADQITRQKETKAITDFVEDAIRHQQWAALGKPLVIMDVGCGNGYTLEVLAQKFPMNKFIGIEKIDEFRTLAASRFDQSTNVSILEGDVRDMGFADGIVADILICQRVLINLLDLSDQQKALNNIVNTVRTPHDKFKGGALLFIEAFQSPLNSLNAARLEFNLPPIESAHHNLYLPDDFFNTPALDQYHASEEVPPRNFLSTHYFVSRVLHPILLKDIPFKRNSEFVSFFTQALKENVGDYSPLKLMLFERINPE
jgi:SAM-dependent methyltransferase